MIVKKPSIYIYTSEPEKQVLREICAGIEEEGVFYEIVEQEATVTVHGEETVRNQRKASESIAAERLAWQAARDSMLGSGVGIFGSACAFSMQGLAAARCVESYEKPDREQCRKLGANSARAMKKQAFK